MAKQLSRRQYDLLFPAARIPADPDSEVTVSDKAGKIGGSEGIVTSQPGRARSPKERSVAEEALKQAMDIRKFEIDLYWKRANYFWTFIAVAFAGLGFVFGTAKEQRFWLLPLYTSLGMTFSFAWFLVNKGSKFWQNNWERHVDLLENSVIGPLYKIRAVNPGGWNFITSADQFSVSKLNQILSFFVSIIWAGLFVHSVLPMDSITRWLFRGADCWKEFYHLGIAALTLITIGVLLICGKSSNDSSNTELYLRRIKVKKPSRPKIFRRHPPASKSE